MRTSTKLSEAMEGLLCCPACRTRLRRQEDRYACGEDACAGSFPVVNGVPVLVHEERSVFRIADYLNHRTPAIQRALAALDELLTQVVPALATNLKARKNFVRLTEALLERTPSPRVLVIGRRILGKGMEDFASHPALELVETDVAFGPRTKIICDAHDLPFADASFDGVVVQAVLEHVADPARCVEEIHRILKPEGVVYAETPFMQ